MPLWVLQLQCYDGTDPDIYQRKIEEGKGVIDAGIVRKEEKEDDDNDTALKILRRVVAHSLTLSSTEHRENKEHLAAVNFLRVENEGHKKSRKFHDVLSRSFGYYFKKREINLLMKQFMRPCLGFDIELFFCHFSFIIKGEEEKHGRMLAVNETELNPLWTQITQRIEYITLCNNYLKRCENKVRNNTLVLLKKVLLDRANSRFQHSIEAMTGVLNHFHFRREINRVLGMTLSLTKANSLFSYFDRESVLKGEDVSQALVYMTIELQKAPKKQQSSPQHNYENAAPRLGQEEQSCSNSVQASQTEEEVIPPLTSKLRPPSKDLFNQTITKISTRLSHSLQQGSFTPLDIPDGFVSETFVRTALYDQLGIKLSRREVFSLCERLRRGNDSSTVSSPTKSKYEQSHLRKGGTDNNSNNSNSFLPQIQIHNSTNRPSKHKNNSRGDSESSKDIILGKYVKVCITRMKQMCWQNKN